MNKRNKIARKKQRGVALLFALGVLALLLVLGLASVTNALLAQKVASNNSSRSQAKMLANSAISRMAISVMFYQYAAKNASPSFIPDNYMSIYSFYDLPKGGTPATSDLAATDGLRYRTSKLVPPEALTNFDYDFTSDSKGKNLLGEWSYLTNKDKRIVGRVAYQLLPTSASAQINLDHLLRGVYSQGSPAGIPWESRWGVGINELNLDETKTFKGWSSDAPASSSDLVASTFDAFFSAYSSSLFASDGEKKKAWIRRWFAEGTVPADPEYYRYDDMSGGKEKNRYYHRFYLGGNLAEGGSLAWYDRLKVESSGTWNAVAVNSAGAVDALAGDSEEFKITDAKTPDGVGLPFLKFIANSPGTFANTATRRKQIVANLNDYCDPDPIPTSDVDAKTWGEDSVFKGAATAWPTYTGNEKTPYINELAFGFKVSPTLKPGSDTYASSNVVVNVKVDRAELIGELIKIYQSPLDNENNYHLLAHLKNLELSFRVTVNGTLNYTDGTTSGSLPLANAVKTSASPITYADQTVTIQFNESTDPPSWKNGYLVYAGAATAPATDNLNLDFSTEFGALSIPSGNTMTSAVIDEVKIEVLNPKFTLGGVALVDMKDSANRFGVDFVRWPDTPLPSTNKNLQLFKHTDIPAADVGASGAGWINGSALSNIPECFRFFYLGGMEAKDPRQNLNPKSTENIAETDWSLFSGIDLVDFDNATPARKLTMDIPVPVSSAQNTVRKVTERLVAGLRNTDADPSTRAAVGGTPPYEGDTEIATDPAWKGDAADQHLSTAYIRNAPMVSPWELGVIHRGAAWETINLKNAMKPGSTTDPISPKDMVQPGDDVNSWAQADGTSYVGGDGGLLEQVKMTDRAYCYGKLNVNMLSDNTVTNPDYTSMDDDMGRSLFYRIRHGQQLYNFSSSTAESQIDWSSTGVVVSPLKAAVTSFGRKFESRSQFLCWKDGSGNSLGNGFGIIPKATWDGLPDAQQEELIGKTIDLVKGSSSISNTIRFIVVAQTIRDLGGEGSDIPIARLRYDGTMESENCQIGRFDVKADGSTFPANFPDNDKFIYYDEITGEVKMLVTMENNPTTGQTIVRQVEYIE